MPVLPMLCMVFVVVNPCFLITHVLVRMLMRMSMRMEMHVLMAMGTVAVRAFMSVRVLVLMMMNMLVFVGPLHFSALLLNHFSTAIIKLKEASLQCWSMCLP